MAIDIIMTCFTPENPKAERFNLSIYLSISVTLKLKDPLSQRYQVELPPGIPQSKADNQGALYTTDYQSDPFGFVVRRQSNGKVM